MRKREKEDVGKTVDVREREREIRHGKRIGDCQREKTCHGEREMAW